MDGHRNVVSARIVVVCESLCYPLCQKHDWVFVLLQAQPVKDQ